MRGWHWALAMMAVAVASMSVAGCAGMGPDMAGGPCLDDSKGCVEQRTAMVHGMAADKSHAWIGEPVSPATAASGVRLFAYQNVKDKLNCNELATGIKEMEDARGSLSGGPIGGQTMERHNQILALTEDVRGQLQTLSNKRCGKA